MNKFLLLLLVLSLGIHNNYAQPQIERDALTALYNGTNGDDWIDNSNWLDFLVPIEEWHGVFVNNGHVTAIVLVDNNLTGTLPTEIGNFPYLVELHLPLNNLTGIVPTEIGNLSNLEILDLAPNGFSGTIPTEIGNLTNLQILWLNQCGLSGNIPLSFQNLTQLKELYLQGSIFGTYEGYPAWKSSEYSGDLPDLTALPLDTLMIQNNLFTYDNIDDHLLTYIDNVTGFHFSPQLTEDEEEFITFSVGDDLTFTMSDTPIYFGNNKNTSAANTYQWYKDGEKITGATSLMYEITNVQETDEGVYIGRITNEDAPDYAHITPPITLSQSLRVTTKEQNEISLYPNPVINELHFDFKHVSQPLIISIYDINGKKIITKKLRSDKALDLNFLSKGMYVVKIKTSRFLLTKKIIKR
ncbi:T9SS type A sorting domain-containing protein [Mesonia ostreae]|uniref:T9SS type A sorting domain-containing protein n=1 Tax=Mesonia ostreae TaxID=861110 RepID=A0ABU2KKV1_9FLAO|nr:T9SS type A sorting domain-containing protein [Mesonia ostreae]MDT0295326.1 T9SS type A sorting domain-containing protein [Mesonia ostreae]